MANQRMSGRFRWQLALVALLLFGFSLVQAQVSQAPPPTEKQRAKLLKQIGRHLKKDAFAYNTDFSVWPQYLAAEEEALVAAKTAGEFTTILNRALDRFGISHLFVLDPQIAAGRSEGTQFGAGFRTVPMFDSLARLVNVVFPESPASEAGIQAGDLIVSVDDEDLDPESLNYPFSPGGRLLVRQDIDRRLQIERDGERHESVIEFADHIAYIPAALNWIEADSGEIAWLTINSFGFPDYQPTEIDEFFTEIHRRAPAGMVLDMRGNGGGRLSHTNHLASYLLDPGTPMVRIFRKDPKVPTGESLAGVGQVWLQLIDRGELQYRGPLVVLIDRGCGSGGDAFPGLMKQARGATLIGERTAGALIGARPMPIAGGYLLIFPIQEHLLPDGTRIEGVGVHPDIALGPIDTTDDEKVRDAALAELSRLLVRNSKVSNLLGCQRLRFGGTLTAI
jgi:C-terminal processing protease CtpA/Prc